MSAPGARQPAGAAAQLKELESEQKKRATRTKRDAIDRALIDLAGFYRDVLAVQAQADVELVNDEMRDAVAGVARSSTPEATLRRIDAVLAARTAIDANVAPLLAVEAMTVASAPADRRQASGTISGAPSRAVSAVWSSGCSCESRSASTRAR